MARRLIGLRASRIRGIAASASGVLAALSIWGSFVFPHLPPVFPLGNLSHALPALLPTWNGLSIVTQPSVGAVYLLIPEPKQGEVHSSRGWVPAEGRGLSGLNAGGAPGHDLHGT